MLSTMIIEFVIVWLPLKVSCSKANSPNSMKKNTEHALRRLANGNPCTVINQI